MFVLFTVLFTILRSPEQDVNAPLIINKIPKSPQDPLNSEIQASCYHLKKKTRFTGSYELELELGPWTSSHTSVLRFLSR